MKKHRLLTVAFCLPLSLGLTDAAYGFGYIFAGEGNGVDLVAHPIGYNGTGGIIDVTVGIDPTSVFATDMSIAVQNVVDTWNAKDPTIGNYRSNVFSGAQIDFESVLLHEVGHSVGLSHVNLASESGLSGAQANGTKSTNGVDNVFNVNNGADNVYGSADDIRGDDVNLNYFRIADNDPFATNLGTIDSTTYSRDLANLPAGDNFSTNPDRSVANLLGYTNTEAAMQQGSFTREVQRQLGADDVAGIRYAESGVDEMAGTADDYTLNLVFAGEDALADIVIDFDDTETGFAVSKSGGTFIGSGHVAITSNNIFFNTGFSWVFSLSGDLDNDGDVDVADLIAASTNFSGSGAMDLTRREGDVDGDGDVDVADLIDISSQFTGAFAGSLAGDLLGEQLIGDFDHDHEHDHGETLVPEPTSAATLAFFGFMLARRRRREPICS